MKSWYKVKAAAGGVDLEIHDEIGLWGISAVDVIDEIKSHGTIAQINLSIHSPGGSVFDGLAIYNYLKAHPARVVGRVQGVAASAASFVLMAADDIVMPEDAYLMIHNPWTWAAGDSAELREQADFLDKMRDTLVNIYQKRTGLDESELIAMLDEETWLNGAEALAKGFADRIDAPMKIAALSADFAKRFARLPQALTDAGTIADTLANIDTLKDFEGYLREAGGLSRGLAKALTSRAKELSRREAGAEAEAETLNAISELKSLLS